MKHVLSVLLGFIFIRPAVGSLAPFLGYAFPGPVWSLHSVLAINSAFVFVFLVVAGGIASWPAQGPGTVHALVVGGTNVAAALPYVVARITTQPLSALCWLLLPVPASLLGSYLSKRLQRASFDNWLPDAQRGASRGAVVGLCFAWCVLAFAYVGNIYQQSRTANLVFWCSVPPGLFLGLAIGVVAGKKWPRLLKVWPAQVSPPGG